MRRYFKYLMRLFLEWWLERLAELLPERLLARARNIDATIIESDRQRLALLVRRAGKTERQAELPPGAAGFRRISAALAEQRGLPRFVVLSIPDADILHKRLWLPLAARGRLEGLLGFEMDRETPFARDEVYWSYSVGRQDVAAGRLEVDLVIVPRATVAPVLDAARLCGIEPAGIEVAFAPGRTMLVRLDPATALRPRWMQRPALALVSVPCLLALVALGVPFARQQLSLNAADRAMASLTAQAQEAAKLRQAINQHENAATFLAKERERAGSALAALALTTRAVPDDSSLTALSMRSGRLTLTGASPSAAGLVGALAKLPGFREPAFAAPVVQSDRGGLETFSISVALAPAGGS
jgi:general secretion pathway protein L